jgi:uncharacterized membrane protein
MPYEWIAQSPDHSELHLWPYRSLPKRGMVAFLGITAALMALPLIGMIGTSVLWGLLPFILGAGLAIWLALSRSFKDAEVVEVLHLRPEQMQLVRYGPGRKSREWHANPHWTDIRLYTTGGPVESYLTLRGAGREVEIGAFLTPAERVELDASLRREIRKFQ